MSAAAVTIPTDTGHLTESQAVEKLLADMKSGRAPEPRTEDELLDDRDTDAQVDPGDESTDENSQVEGDEFSDEDTETASTADPVVKFDDGSELALSEVKRGYLRQQDYTRKTQEAAELRKAIEAERTNYVAEKKQVADRINPLIQHALSIIENPAMQAELNVLRETDPGAYAVRMMDIQTKRSQLEQLAWQERQLRESSEREEAERSRTARAEAAKQSREVLIQNIPAFKKDFNAEYQRLGKFLIEEVGIPTDAWDNEVDHRVITLAWEAMQYRNATRKTPATKEQLRKAPQTMRPGTAKPPGHAQERALREATERAHKSGSMDDMIALQKLKIGARR